MKLNCLITDRRSCRSRKGVVYILALVAMSVLTVLSVSLATQSSLSLVKSENHKEVLQARLSCESGLEFLLHHIGTARIRQPSTAADLASLIGEHLGRRLDGTACIGGESVTVQDADVFIPQIAIGQQTTNCVITCLSDSRCRITSSGKSGVVTRRASIELTVKTKRSAAFDYGIASRGPVTISGNARLIGVNSPSEASVISTTNQPNAISIQGSSYISGDLSVSGADSNIIIQGSPTIGNTSDPSLWPQHCHFGATEPDFPLYDTSPLAALATNVINGSTDLSKVTTLNNILIKANTNPTFSNKTVINGIVYVESPNKVNFTGQVVVNGMVVTEAAAPSQLSSCQISFSGGVEAFGVEVLPDTPEFAAVKQQQGTSVLAPGFGVSFSGHVSAVNGSIAADQLTFTGTAEGTIKGSVIGLRDLPTSFGGTVDIFVDREGASENPAGFIPSYKLFPSAQSYRELLPGE